MSVATVSEMDATDLAFLLASLVLAGLHLYLVAVTWAAPGEPTFQFALIALTFLAIAVAHATRSWRDLFYLLCAGFAVYLGVLWALGGMAYPAVGVVTGVVATAFIALSFYLFFRDVRETGDDTDART